MPKLPQSQNDFPALGIYYPGAPVVPSLGRFSTTDSSNAQVVVPAMADIVRAFIDMGRGYSATTGILTSATGTNNYPLAIFNPSTNTRPIVIYSIQVSNGSGGQTCLLQLITSNPAFANQITPINMNTGGSASGLSASDITTTTVSQTITGPYEQVVALASSTLELLTNGSIIELSANNGLVVYVQTYGAGINAANIRWIEL